MLRVELATQLLRIRTLVALACLAAVPVIAGLATASHAGRHNGTQGGLFGASTLSALNHAMACLMFIGPLLLPLVVALLASAIGSADRDWGTLRYLYVAPVGRRRLLTGKLAAVTIVTTGAVLAVLIGGLLTGIALFGWHPFHILNAPTLTTGQTLTRVTEATGYTLLCMLSIATIAFAFGLLLPRGAEALGASLAFVVIATILNQQSSLHRLAAVLPVHYWQSWTALFSPSGTAPLATGALCQLITIALATTLAFAVLHRRDPAA
ncbi:ABC transporter permease [Actinomadura harenae]|uniref:ABC transporter permease n=1 Tax=Actinomadura harenae TaxID=2483351 RepID=A0A3M2M106_9ACTN|nr:ABC transporter permease [Actinomadura harenae]RMI43297.1 ABC transporter permease [Actinomadura harenae]